MLCLCWMHKSLAYLVQSKQAKQEVSCTVILPPMARVLWVGTKGYEEDVPCLDHPSTLISDMFEGGCDVDFLATFWHPVQDHVDQDVSSGTANAIAVDSTHIYWIYILYKSYTVHWVPTYMYWLYIAYKSYAVGIMSTEMYWLYIAYKILSCIMNTVIYGLYIAYKSMSMVNIDVQIVYLQVFGCLLRPLFTLARYIYRSIFLFIFQCCRNAKCHFMKSFQDYLKQKGYIKLILNKAPFRLVAGHCRINEDWSNADIGNFLSLCRIANDYRRLQHSVNQP